MIKNKIIWLIVAVGLICLIPNLRLIANDYGVNQMTVTSISTVTSTTTELPLPGIPGFPIEAILAGFAIGIIALAVIRQRRDRVPSWQG